MIQDVEKPNVIQISLLGNFKIQNGTAQIEETVNRSKKMWNLLGFIITYRKKHISQNEYIDMLWPDEISSNPVNALKTLLSRVRNLLEPVAIHNENFILSSQGSYQWNNRLPCMVDIEEFESFVKDNGWELMYVSAATGKGLKEMITRTAELLEELPPMLVYEAEYLPEDEYVGASRDTTVRRENDTFFVEGEWLFNLVGQVNFENYESLNFFQRVLKKSGVFELLESKGCTDGMTVSIYGFEFDYVR